MVLVSSGQLQLTNLNDSKALQLFLSSSQPNTQVYNQTSGGYTPDWSSSKPVITPELYVAGTSTNILAQAKSITWFDGGSQISSGTNYTLGTGNQTLTVNTNRVIPIDDALSFDSSTTKVATTTNPFSSAPTALTLMAKFRMVATPANFTTIAEFGVAGTTTGFYLEGSLNSPQILFGGAVTSGGTAFGGASNETRSSNLSLNQFHTAALVVTSTTMTAYIDGTLVGTVAGTYDLTKAAQVLNIGGGRYFFNGDIAYVGVFNTAVPPEFISLYNTNGLKGTEPGLVNYYDLTKASGTTVTDSVGGKNGTISGTFTLPSAATIHKKTLLCQVVYTDPAVNTDLIATTSIDIVRQYTGATGNQGPAVAVGFLSNDNSVVTTANDGTGGTYGAPNTQTTLQIFLGGTDVTNLYTISQARTNVTVTEATTSATATVTAMSADTGSVVFTATRTGYPTITKTFSLLKSKMGALAPSPTDYWLNVSTSNIAAADNGSYTPSNFTVSAESQTGTNPVGTYAARFIISESTDGTNFTVKYTSAADESSSTYTPSSGLAAIKVDMYQAGGTSVKLDTQTIPVVHNGKNSVMVSAWTPTGNVIHNAGNTVTAEADLLNGGLPDTGSNYRWVKQNGAATSVIAGAGYEDLDAPKRNYIKGSNVTYSTTGSLATSKSLSPALTFSADAIAAMNRTGQINISLDYQVTNLVAGPTNPWVGMEITVTYSDSTNGWYDAAGSMNGSNHIPAGTSSGRTSSTYALKTGVTVTAVVATVLVRDVTGSVSMTNFKMEMGTQATPWCAAYEEIAIDTTIDSVLYGRNLIQNSKNPYMWYCAYGGSATATVTTVAGPVTVNGYSVSNIRQINFTSGQSGDFRLSGVQGTSGDANTTLTNLIGRTFAFSAWVYSNVAQTVSVNVTGTMDDDTTTQAFSLAANTWTRVNMTKKFNSTTHNGVRIRMTLSVTGTLQVALAKLEESVYTTDWTPAPEDNDTADNPIMTAGTNKWIYKNFPLATANGNYLVTYTDLASITTTGSRQTLLADGTNLVQSDGLTNYYGYLKTAVYTSTAKTLNITFTHDDSCSVYVNGLAQYQKTVATAGATAALVLQQGWNHIEFIYNQASGGDGVYNISPTFSSSVDEINADYAVDYGSLKGNYGVTGYNTSSMIVNTNAVTDTDLFMCVVTYRGSTYKDTVTIDDVTDPMTLVIEGADFFKNGQGTNSYTARLYQNGAEIDTGGTQHTYTWYVYNADGSQDMTFGGSGSKTGKTITLTASDINVSGDIVCNVS